MKRILLTLTVLLWATSAEAIYYVGKFGSTGTPGSDAVNCTQAQNPATPKLTITNMLDNCFTYGAGAAANQILEISAGTYAENLVRISNWPKGSSWSAPFIIRGKAGDVVTIQPTSYAFYIGDGDMLGVPFYIIIDNIKVNGANVPGGPGNHSIASFADYVRWQNNEFYNTNGCNTFLSRTSEATSGSTVRLEFINNTFHDGNHDCVGGAGGDQGYPIYLSRGGALIENNRFYNVPRFGVHLFGGTCPNDVVVRNNKFWNVANSSQFDAAIIACGNNHQIYNNEIRDSRGGIDTSIVTPQTNVRLFNNTIYNVSLFGIRYNSSGVTARNNILYNPVGLPEGGYFGNHGAGAITASHNLCGPSGGCIDMVSGGVVGTGTSLNTNPRFANVANADFRVCTGPGVPHASCTQSSPALLAGQNLTSLGIAGLLTDAAGVTRPAPPTLWTIGALQGGAPPSGPIVTITSPTTLATYSVTSATFALSGTASSGVAVSKVTWACPTCTPTSGTATGTASWSITGITLALGNNVITVTATDTNAQTANDVLTVNYLAQNLVYAAGFDEASGTSVLDASGNGNTGTLGSGVTRVAGITGGALFFDGTVNGVLTVPDSNSLDLTSGYTISVYVSPTELVANSWRTILRKFDNYWFYVTSGDGSCPAGDKVYGGFNIAGSGYQAVCSGSPLTTGEWTYVTYQYDGVNQRIYFNTTLVASQPSSGFIPANADDLMIGNSPFLEGFKGFMDRLRIYNYGIPLTAGSNTCSDSPSITRDMNCPIGAPPIITIKLNVTSLKVGPNITRKWGFGP